jgi:4-alpha-glucanotransferase
MRIRFNVFCHTDWGQQVHVLGTLPELGSLDSSRSREMSYTSGHTWTTEIMLPPGTGTGFKYRYMVRNDAGGILLEETNNRTFPFGPNSFSTPEPDDLLELIDTWNPPSDPDSLFMTAPFLETIFRRTSPAALQPRSDRGRINGDRITVRLSLINPRVHDGDTISVVGSIEALGEWDSEKAVPMDPSDIPCWNLDLSVEATQIPFLYKYLIKDRAGKVVAHEEGPDRSFQTSSGGPSENPVPARFVAVMDNKFRYKKKWRGAGIALPLFSVRSEKGLGVGELPDLKGLVDWACESGLQLIQLLPINDTMSGMNWMDSFPYSCISVFALHPIYLNLDNIGGLPEGMYEEIEARRKVLNDSAVLEYEEVLAVKLPLLRRIFEAGKEAFLSSPEFRSFFEEHGYWLKVYAAFSALRDHFRTGDCLEWGRLSVVNEEDIAMLTAPESEYFDRVAFYYFLQYHLHLQLSDASRYAREHGVVLKGDIPIGIQKRSDSCWINPGLFHMGRSAGAPPDPFSDAGQNWGFPTYNWEEMSRDNYSWWRRRMSHMSLYFQMIRLDHVLGFFRIWEIPDDQFSGLMGRFNPALPVTIEELQGLGIWDSDRLTEPYVTSWLIKAAFGREWTGIMADCFHEPERGRFELKPEFTTQRLVARQLAARDDGQEATRMRRDRLEDGFLTLISDVVLFKDTSGNGFHPRINLSDTASFACLEGWMREKLVSLYNDYFYHRQENFWREQAMVKLPVLKKVSNMLICGEDLGMIPDCVPTVMEDLCLLGLRIQRMPREPDREFGYPWEYSYLTVASTSSHDMSTMRGWWEEDRARTARYYRVVLGHEEEAPLTCEPSVCEEIVRQHLESPSMWAIFPIQDILAISKELRRPGDPREEQINDPSDMFHLWKFRLHLTIEQLMKEKGFSFKLQKMMEESGRKNSY